MLAQTLLSPIFNRCVCLYLQSAGCHTDPLPKVQSVPTAGKVGTVLLGFCPALHSSGAQHPPNTGSQPGHLGLSGSQLGFIRATSSRQACACLQHPSKLQAGRTLPQRGERRRGEGTRQQSGTLPETSATIVQHLPSARDFDLPGSPHNTPEPPASPQGCQLLVSVSMATPHLLFWFLMTYWHVW